MAPSGQFQALRALPESNNHGHWPQGGHQEFWDLMPHHFGTLSIWPHVKVSSYLARGRYRTQSQLVNPPMPWGNISLWVDIVGDIICFCWAAGHRLQWLSVPSSLKSIRSKHSKHMQSVAIKAFWIRHLKISSSGQAPCTVSKISDALQELYSLGLCLVLPSYFVGTVQQ